MKIHSKRNEEGDYQLSIDFITFQLPETAILRLKEIISVRLNQSSDLDNENLTRKLVAYRKLADKLVLSNDRVVQEFAIALTTEQLVTIARLADGNSMFEKIIRNLSRQNGKQFQLDFNEMASITESQAVINMENAIPIIRKMANKVKNQSLGIT